MTQPNLNEIYRAVGRIEGKIDDLIVSCRQYEERIQKLETITDQYIGKTSIIGSVVGFIGGIIASIIVFFATNK
jgi:hypothetical protein